jgi:hypothetical protein
LGSDRRKGLDTRVDFFPISSTGTANSNSNALIRVKRIAFILVREKVNETA